MVDSNILNALIILNAALSVLVVAVLLWLTVKQKGKTINILLRFLMYGFVILAVSDIAQALGAFGIGILEWPLLSAVGKTLFLLVVIFIIFFLRDTLAAYEHLLGRKEKMEGKLEWKRY